MWHTITQVAKNHRLDAEALKTFALSDQDRYGIIVCKDGELEISSWFANELVGDFVRGKKLPLLVVDCDYQDCAVCPYCGKRYKNTCDLRFERDGEEETVECGQCEREYKVIFNLNPTYSTAKIPFTQGESL